MIALSASGNYNWQNNCTVKKTSIVHRELQPDFKERDKETENNKNQLNKQITIAHLSSFRRN